MNYRRLIPVFFGLLVAALWACSEKSVREDGFTPSPIVKSDKPKPEPEPAYKAPEDLKTVFFEYDKSVLRPEAKKALLKNVEWLKKHRNTKVQVEGHCDERGTREYNYKLGQKRAETVKQFLMNNGIEESRILTVSYGAIGEQNEKSWSKYRKAMSVIIFEELSATDK